MTKIYGIILTVILAFPVVSFAQKSQRYIAVTIDDLPVVSKRNDIKVRQRITKDLLAHIKKSKVPAVGFVNENKLFRNDKRDETEIDLLRKWLDAGLELGNHTYSHMSLHDNSLEDYKANILKGEVITKELLNSKGMKMRYFRHPYLWTGLDLEIKADLSKFLIEHRYIIAPVTIDNSDYIYASAYDNAIISKDEALKLKIGKNYVSYLEQKVEYWEKQSIKLFDREIKQILLLHANEINADYFDDLAKMLSKRGYKFINLESALTDEAYKLPDRFVKRNGISWLHRWALDRGREFVVSDEPKVPAEILKIAGIESE